jgi:hypothetical protein
MCLEWQRTDDGGQALRRDEPRGGALQRAAGAGSLEVLLTSAQTESIGLKSCGSGMTDYQQGVPHTLEADKSLREVEDATLITYSFGRRTCHGRRRGPWPGYAK